VECLLTVLYHSAPLEIPIHTSGSGISVLIIMFDRNLHKSIRWEGGEVGLGPSH
jgi:hypothetical protein